MKKTFFVRIITVIIALSLIMLSCSTIFAMDNNIEKNLPEIIPSEWEDLNEEPIKAIPYMVSAPILGEVEGNDTVGTADNMSLTLGRSGKIGSSTDVDFYWFTPAATGKYRFDLVNVPKANGKDYELAIYNESQTLVGIATSSEEYETIIVNLTASSKYYVKVYGFNGAYSTTDTYYITVTNDACALLNYKYPFRGIGAPRTLNANYGTYPEGGAHYGIDIGAAIGTPLYSVGGGTFLSKGLHTSAGNYISVKMNSEFSLPSEDTVVTYMHMNSISSITSNTEITSNTLLGYSGNTGVSSGPHLHLQINNNGGTMSQSLSYTNNPLRYFTNYKFTGQVEDLTEYSIRTIDNNEIIEESMYMIDIVFIEYVGMESCNIWKNLTSGNATIADFLNYFCISSDDFLHILDENPRLKDFYNIDKIMNMIM